MNPRAIISALTLLAMVTGCQEDSLNTPPVEQENTPAVSNTTDTLSYAVDANQFTHSQSITITFTAPQLAIGYSVSGFGGGVCIIGVSDSIGALARLDTLRSDTSLTSVRFMSHKPRYVTIRFEGFTGRASLSLQREMAIRNFSITDFPYREGAWWRYRVEDYLASSGVDTVLVRAVQDTNVDGRLAVLWLITYPNRTESMYVIRSDDSLWMIEQSPPEFGLNDVVCPLWFGKQWVSDQTVSDSSMVVAILPGAVPAGSFPICHVVDQRWDGLGVAGRYTAWLAPGIGIVLYYRTSAIPLLFEEWALIDYSVPSL